MSILCNLLTTFVGLLVLLSAGVFNWSEPVSLRQIPTYINDPRIASASNGYAIVIWNEVDADSPSAASGGDIFARILTPGSDWGPATVISDGSGYLQPPAVVAMGPDGTAIAAWRQVNDSGSQIVGRKFVPGAGWGALQVLSTFGIDPKLAIAPDGRAHIVFDEGNHGQYGAWVAKTLTPGEDVWSQTVVLAEGPYGTPAELVAGDGFAYAALPIAESSNGTADYPLEVAEYTPDGWQPAVKVSNGSVLIDSAQLIANGGHVVLSWVESGSGTGLVQEIQQLTGPSTTFSVPVISAIFTGSKAVETTGPCPIALLPDGSVIAVCGVQGTTIPGCPLGVPGGVIPAFYMYLETFRHPVNGDWLGPEVISDVQRRVLFVPTILANSLGDAVVLWTSDVPCQPNTTALSSRLWTSSTASWQPEMTVGDATSSFIDSTGDLIADPNGTFRLLFTDIDINNNLSSQVTSTLLTTELPTGATTPGDVNGDGIVDCTDLDIVRTSLGMKVGDPGYDARADVNQDGVVDIRDLAFVAQHLAAATQCQ